MSHTCGLRHVASLDFGGRPVCWGMNHEGACSPPDVDMVQVSAGGLGASCGLTLRGQRVVCWGSDPVQGGPQGADADLEYTQVSVGGFHACALTAAEGRVVCWGKNYAGQADPSAANRAAARAGGFVQVSCGRDHSCGVGRDGLLRCWGANELGQAEAPHGQQFLQVSASLWRHTCGVTLGGAVLCFGHDGHGQSAPRGPGFDDPADANKNEKNDGENENEHEEAAPPAGKAPQGGKRYTQVSAGRLFTCAITSGYELECWGDAGHAVSVIHRGVERAREGGVRYAQVSAGAHHACAAREDGSKVDCWGVGEGRHTPRTAQVPATFLPAV